MAPEHKHQTEEDMISKLTDDVLLLILEKVNLSTTVKASVLPKRWRNFPWLLTQLNIDIQDFLHETRADPIVDQIYKTVSSLSEMVRSMMAPTRRKSIIIAKLCISLFLTNIYSNEIGDIVNEAVENGMVKDIELISGVERLPFDVPDDEMVKHADDINSLFGNYPKISCCLLSLILYNATFCKSDLHNLLANTCTELQYLYLYQCDTGINTLFKIDAPNSKLNVLEFAHCSWAQVEVGCLPKLEQLILGYWSSPYLPLTLGCVPCLKEVDIYSGTASYQKQPFKLSELLGGTTCITTLTLDLLGQKIWLKPEKYQLRSAFSNLRELLVHGIFVGFGLLWTTSLLEAAPSLETLDIEVYDHLCGYDEEEKRLYGERTNAPWDVSEFAKSSKSLPLRELKLCGFNATEEQIVFIGAVMKRASNLQAIILKEQHCKNCNAISTPITSGECRFPSNEGLSHVYDHRCEDEEKKKEIYGERTNAPWQVSDTAHPQHPSLKELQLFGFNATEQHMAFIGAVIKRASNLQTVLLNEQYCDYCNAISTTFGECGFPKNEDEQELVVDNIRNRFSFRAQIIFSGHKLCSD